MKLHQLVYFVTVIKAGGITNAARRLKVSQPALSSGLKALEDELGGTLLDRRSGQHPTALGEAFLRRAQNILQECEAAKIEFRRGLGNREIKLGVLSTIPISYILRFVRDFKMSQPGTNISLREGSGTSLLSWLSSGRVDAAVMAMDAMEGGEWTFLYEEPFVLVCSPDHSVADSKLISVSFLNDEPFVLRTHCERMGDAHKIIASRGVRLDIILRTDNDNRALETVRQNFGVTIAPKSFAEDLAIVYMEDLVFQRTIGIRLSNRIGRSLSDTIVESLRAACQAR